MIEMDEYKMLISYIQNQPCGASLFSNSVPFYVKLGFQGLDVVCNRGQT